MKKTKIIILLTLILCINTNRVATFAENCTNNDGGYDDNKQQQSQDEDGVVTKGTKYIMQQLREQLRATPEEIKEQRDEYYRNHSNGSDGTRG